MHLFERWTRTGPTSLEYTVTVEDPTVWMLPWTVKQEFTKQSDQENRIYYEPRCVEGNYALPGLLRGRRMEELAFAEGRGPDPATKNNTGAIVNTAAKFLRIRCSNKLQGKRRPALTSAPGRTHCARPGPPVRFRSSVVNRLSWANPNAFGERRERGHHERAAGGADWDRELVFPVTKPEADRAGHRGGCIATAFSRDTPRWWPSAASSASR